MKITENKMTKAPAYRFSGYTDAWEQRKLGEMANLSSSKRVHLKDYVPEGIPFYRGSEISAGGLTGQNELFISYSLYEDVKLKYGVPKKNDLLITAVGTLGNVWKVDDRKFYYKDGNLILISEMKCATDYLYSYLSDGVGKKRVLDSGSGSNQKALTMVKLREVELPLPTLAEQTAIGNFFQTLDRSIALHQRKLDSLKEQKKTYLQKLFPRNGETIPEIRFPEFQNAPTWEQRKLGEVGETFTGLSGKTKEDFGHGDAKFITYVNVFNNPLATIEGVDKVEIDEKQSQVNFGDVLFTTSSEIPEEVGMSSVWLWNEENVYLNSFCFGYRPEKGIFNPYYLAFMLRSFAIRREFMLLAQGISRYNISKKKVMEISVPLPTLSEQTAIGNFFQTLDRSIAQHQTKLDKLKESKQTLLKKMFV